MPPRKLSKEELQAESDCLGCGFKVKGPGLLCKVCLDRKRFGIPLPTERRRARELEVAR